MEFGILVSAAGDLKSTLSVATRYLGMLKPDIVWASDSMLRNGAPQLACYDGIPEQIAVGKLLDPFIVLAALASKLDYHPKMGIAVTDFIRRKPTDLARCSFTISQLIGSSFNMGFGLGVPNNVSTVGYQYPNRPVDFFQENLESFCEINQGSSNCIKKAYIRELGYHAVPSQIWVGGQKDRMLDLTARYANGWIPAVKMEADQYEKKLQVLHESAKAYGRTTPKAAMFVSLLLGRSKRKVLEAIENNIIAKIPALFGTSEAWTRQGYEYPFELIPKGGGGGSGNIVLSEINGNGLYQLIRSIPAMLVSTAYFIGNADDVAEELYRFKRAGVQHLVLPLPNVTEAALNSDHEEVFCEYSKLINEVRHW